MQTVVLANQHAAMGTVAQPASPVGGALTITPIEAFGSRKAAELVGVDQ